MASRFDKSALIGLVEAKAAFKAATPIIQDKLADATEATVRVIAFQAQTNVRRRFGILAQHIRWSMSRATGVGKVGIGPRETIWTQGKVQLGARVAGDIGAARLRSQGAISETPTAIAHLIEFGHGGPHPAPAYPFMIPAAEGERENYLQRCRNAGQEAEQTIAATGGGLL